MAAGWASHQQPGFLARFSIRGEVEDLSVCEKNISQSLWKFRINWIWLRGKVAMVAGGESSPCVISSDSSAAPPLLLVAVAYIQAHTHSPDSPSCHCRARTATEKVELLLGKRHLLCFHHGYYRNFAKNTKT